MAATPATTLNLDLQTAINLNYNNKTEIAPIAPAAGNIAAAGPTNSIHVPFIKDTAGNYTQDSCITITTLLNQWNAYTKDHTPGSAGILTGYDDTAANTVDRNAHLFAVIFGGAQQAFDSLTAIVAAAPGTIQGDFGPELALLVDPNEFTPPAAAAAAAANPAAPTVPFYGGWSNLLNNIAAHFADNRKSCGANEMLVPAAPGAPGAPTLSQGNTTCIPPADLIRYAFGLLYKIKRVLGSDWPETHNQLTMGGRNSKNNNKRNKYTHRKKQYSQRRYKK
jgi:hypothetical protein